MITKRCLLWEEQPEYVRQYVRISLVDKLFRIIVPLKKNDDGRNFLDVNFRISLIMLEREGTLGFLIERMMQTTNKHLLVKELFLLKEFIFYDFFFFFLNFIFDFHFFNSCQ